MSLDVERVTNSAVSTNMPDRNAVLTPPVSLVRTLPPEDWIKEKGGLPELSAIRELVGPREQSGERVTFDDFFTLAAVPVDLPIARPRTRIIMEPAPRTLFSAP